MKLRKPLAFLLTLALLLGAPPIAGASGAVDEPSTTFESISVLSDTQETPEDNRVVTDTIDVTFKNKTCPIQINPYGMTVKYSDESGKPYTSGESIASVPIYIKNNTDVQVDVTTQATVVPTGDIKLRDVSTRIVLDPATHPDKVMNDEDVYLYLYFQMVEQSTPLAEVDWDSVDEKEVITKPDGSDPITRKMPAKGGVALKVGGDTSIPAKYGQWNSNHGFTINFILTFLPKQEENYSVTFDVQDLEWDGKKLNSPVTIELQEGNKADISTLTFDKDHGDAQEVKAKENLAFTIKVKEGYYVISGVRLSHMKKDSGELLSQEYLYHRQTAEIKYNYTYTQTINASKVDLTETLLVEVFLDSILDS